MQLKKSLFNKTLFKNNIKNVWPILAGACLGGLLTALTLVVSVIFDNKTLTVMSLKRYYFEFAVNANPILSLIYAFIVGYIVWEYLYNQKSISFMHSLPLKREEIFFTNFKSGMFMMVFPYVGSGLITVITSVFTHSFDLYSLLQTILVVLANSFIFFTLATFSALLAGNIVMYAIMYGTVNFGYCLLDFLFTTFGNGFLLGISSDYSGRLDFLSPIVRIMKTMDVNLQRGENYYDFISVELENARVLIFYALAMLALTFFSMLLHKNYKSENAQNPLSFKIVEYIYIAGTTICVALAGGLILYAIFGETIFHSKYYNLPVIMFFTAFSAILGYFASKMVAEKTTKVFNNSKKKIFALILSSIILCLGYKIDVFGIERYVPDITKIESIRMISDGYYGDSINAKENTEIALKTLDVHKAIVKKGNKLKYDDYINKYRVYFTYYLNDGRKIERTYYLSQNDEDILSKIYDKKFIDFKYPEKDIESIEVNYIPTEWKDYSYGQEILKLEGKEKTEFINIFKEELSENYMDIIFDKNKYEKERYEINFTIEPKGAYMSFEVNDKTPKSFNYLEEKY